MGRRVTGNRYEALFVSITKSAHTWYVGKDIGAFMHHWVASIGFPVITVKESGDGKSITVRQDRFLEDGEPEEKDNQTIWCAHRFL